ncbi:MAG: SRPBCC family protein [Candidatus Eremiobacteraeota bacterium]|nr:SRPBCC family protein [Candidatus Eremiobacteraeota bacterium]
MPSKLDVTTPSEREIRVMRTFDAPPALVFECHTQPELVQRWLLGPPGWTMPVCEIDLRVGGRYRYVWRNDDDGQEFGVQGVFRDIVAPERIVNVETMDGVPGEAVCTTTFERSGGGTLFTLTLMFESKELRDGALESGMTDGMSMSYDRLDDVTLRSSPQSP